MDTLKLCTIKSAVIRVDNFCKTKRPNLLDSLETHILVEISQTMIKNLYCGDPWFWKTQRRGTNSWPWGSCDITNKYI
jgi:hypothetical protein